ncbi:MAG: HAMP domain-containing histidine kinase [Lachnospiraceae bacterium]
MKNKKIVNLFFLLFIFSVLLFLAGRSFALLRPGRRSIFVIFCIMAVCGLWLIMHLSKIKKGIEAVAQRSYTPMPEKGIFSEIYGALNKMDKEIRNSDKLQEETERMRSEWIANITHDLKTPLSPIKGYAELLADTSETDGETARQYGEIILKNANYTEKLINDLKLTYQLDSGAMPFHPQSVNLVRYMKEAVIDIVNDPAFQDRNIGFESSASKLAVNIDADLFRRAVSNLIMNALTHNSQETKVTISIAANSENSACICIADNGRGITEEAQAELFTRYYRGTSTKEMPEGSGLGLAIAKQIITLHGGDITVQSKLNEGTQFRIILPCKNDLSLN